MRKRISAIRGRGGHGRSGVVAGLAFALLASGCVSAPRFPTAAIQEDVLAYDVDGDRVADYWQRRDAHGRTTRVRLAEGAAGEVELDAIAVHDVPHVIIVLDGVPFSIVDDLYRAGHFRLFHPPSRVISCFPSLTDLALAELFQSPCCRGYQALYFDRARNELSEGHRVYLRGENSPWLAAVDYRASSWWDTVVYLNPQLVFDREMQQIYELARTRPAGQLCAYSVGSAGLGTRGGEAAIRDYLGQVDALCERLVYEHAGRIKLTVTADHGHNLTVNRRVDFDAALRAAGYRPARRLDEVRDVVCIEYGLVTFAAFHTRDPAGVAACLAGHPDVEFAGYRDGARVVLCDRSGQATIRRTAGGLAYDRQTSDPLELAPVLARLLQAGHVADDGSIDATALFEATSTHRYPDPLARVWRAFDDLVEHPADVLVNLRAGACHGSEFFSAMIGEVRSTHGALNGRDSTTFVLTMLGELPPVLRSREVLPAVTALGAAVETRPSRTMRR